MFPAPLRRRFLSEGKRSGGGGAAMKPRWLWLWLVALAGWSPRRAGGYFPEERWLPESPLRPPRVLLALLARNSAHSLPAALGCIERLRHPKDRIALWWVS